MVKLNSILTIDQLETSFLDSIDERIYDYSTFLIHATNEIHRITFTSVDAFYKPKSGEKLGLRKTIPNQYYIREVLAYETTKIFGLNGLIPPTTIYNPKEASIGSLQQSAYLFGEKFFGLTDIHAAFTEGEKYKETINSLVNVSDMVIFDFIIGNLDRNGFNYFVGNKNTGKRIIAIDNGLTFPETGSREFNYEDWFSTIKYFMLVLRSEMGSKPINKVFNTKILEYNSDSFKKLARKYNLSSKAEDGVLFRWELLKTRSIQKYNEIHKNWQPEDFSNMEEYTDFVRNRVRLTPYDVAIIFEKEYGVCIV
jgi:hypothetical protein